MELHAQGRSRRKLHPGRHSAPLLYPVRAADVPRPQIFYTLSSFYIIFLMTSVYARTREREKAWKLGMYCLLGALVVAPFWYLVFKSHVIGHSHFMKVRTHPTQRLSSLPLLRLD